MPSLAARYGFEWSFKGRQEDQAETLGDMAWGAGLAFATFLVLLLVPALLALHEPVAAWWAKPGNIWTRMPARRRRSQKSAPKKLRRAGQSVSGSRVAGS